MQRSDGELLQALRSGDEGAFVILYRRLQGPVFRFAFHMSGSRATAEDVTQEVFLILIRRPEGYDSTKGTLAGYLLGIARNCLLRELKRHKDSGAEDPVNSAAAGPLPKDTARNNPLSDLLRGEILRKVREAILSLPVNYREVLVLCELQDRTYQEAAQVLNCSEGTIRSRLHRARALLLRKLKKCEPDMIDPKSQRCLA